MIVPGGAGAPHNLTTLLSVIKVESDVGIFACCATFLSLRAVLLGSGAPPIVHGASRENGANVLCSTKPTLVKRPSGRHIIYRVHTSILDLSPVNDQYFIDYHI